MGYNSPRHVLAENPITYKNNPFIPNFWKAEALNEKVRTWQPGIVLNERFGDWVQGGTVHGLGYGDFRGSEKEDILELSVSAKNRQAVDPIYKIEFDRPVSDIYKKADSERLITEKDFSDRAVNLGEL